MTYQEMLDTRVSRAEVAAQRKAEWLKNADIDQLENDLKELEEFESLAAED